jgi:hypothetical protein
MALIAEHIKHIKTILSSGLPSDDFRISDRHLYFILRYIRAELIKQKIESGYLLSSFNYQSVDCIDLCLQPITDCTCYTSTCKSLQSDIEIPTILSVGKSLLGSEGLAIEGVWTLENEEIYPTSRTKVSKHKYTKTKNSRLRYFIHNKRIHVVGSTRLKSIKISAVFEDPSALSELTLCGTASTSCFDPYTEDFPMDMHLTRILNSMTYDEILKVASKVNEDVNNNASGEVIKSI